MVINRVFKGGLHLEDNIGVKMEGGRRLRPSGQSGKSQSLKACM